MKWRNLFGRSEPAPQTSDAVLVVRVDGRTVGTFRPENVGGELLFDVPIDAPPTIEFEDAAGTVHRHHVPAKGGWLHLSVRVHSGLGCQADAVVTAHAEHAAGALIGEDDVGVRFQPFFLAGAVDPPVLTGRGLFARGLHFSGTITPENVLLSCECDRCARSFIVRSFHAGFSEVGYFYSGSGKYTLTVDARLEGAPAALADPNPAALSALEARLPAAPDGTRFAYRNPFRCPYCDAAYIDFAAHPEQRRGEYYGLYRPDTPPIRFEAEPGQRG